MRLNLKLKCLALCLCFFSCEKDIECVKCTIPKRTVIAYLAGDNSLSTEAWLRADSLLAGWHPDLGELLIAEHSWSTKQPILMRAVMKGNRVKTDTLSSYGLNANMADAKIWKQVLADAATMVPSDSYGLVVFSHATGWLPSGAYEQRQLWKQQATTRSLVEGKGMQMELADFAAAIPDGMFDYILFDMCFMASVEACYALRNKTNYIVASAGEVLSPGFLPIYHPHLAKLFANEPDLTGLARSYYEYHSRKSGQECALVSVVNTRKMDELACVVRQVQSGMTEYTDTTGLQYYDRKGAPWLFFDLADYLHRIDTASAYPMTIDSVISSAVEFRRNTPRLLNIDIKRHCGLSVFIPQTVLAGINDAYKGTEWGKATYPAYFLSR